MIRNVLSVFADVGWIIALGIVLTSHQNFPNWIYVLLIISSVISIFAAAMNLIGRYRKRFSR